MQSRPLIVNGTETELRDVFEAPSVRRVSWVRSDSGRAGRQGRERVQSCAASRSVVIYFCASRTSAMRTRRELMSARGMPQSQQRRRLIDTLTVRSGSRKFPAKVPDAISIPVSSVQFSWQPNWIPLRSYVEIVLPSSSFDAPCC